MAIAAVTGGGGFIGTAVVRALQRDGFDVRVALGPPADFDITDVAAVREFVKGCGVLVHAAGPPSVAASFHDPLEFVRVHTLGTATVLEACRSESIGKLVYISTAEVYGRPRSEFVAEHHPLEPRSPYGAAKAAAEILVRSLAPASGIGSFILRPFSVFGSSPTPHSLLAEIFAQVENGDTVYLNDLAPVRDYCYVEDVADAIVRACKTPVNGAVALNVASGAGTSAADLAAAVASSFGKRAEIRERPNAKRPANAEIYRLVADVNAIQRELGWTPRYDLENGLRAALAVRAAV